MFKKKQLSIFLMSTFIFSGNADATIWSFNGWDSGVTDWEQENVWLDENGDPGNPPSVGGTVVLNRPAGAGVSASHIVRLNNDFDDFQEVVTPTLGYDEIHINAAQTGTEAGVLHNNYQLSAGSLYLNELNDQQGKAVYSFTSDAAEAYQEHYFDVTNQVSTDLSANINPPYSLAEVTHADNDFLYVYSAGTTLVFPAGATVTYADGSSQTFAAGEAKTFTEETTLDYVGETVVTYEPSTYYTQIDTITVHHTVNNNRALSLNNAYVGVNGEAELNIKNATTDNFTISDSLYIGGNSEGKGVVNLDNSEFGLVSRDDDGFVQILYPEKSLKSLIVGVDGDGEFNQNGGFTAVEGFNIGFNPGSTGRFTLTGDGEVYGKSLLYPDAIIGNGGTGIMLQESGKVSFNDKLIIGNSGTGSYDLNDGSLNTFHLIIGNQGEGVFTQRGGENIVGAANTFHPDGRHGILQLGRYPGSWLSSTERQGMGDGRYNLIDGHLLASEEYIGDYHDYPSGYLTEAAYGGRGVFIQTGGVNDVLRSLSIGDSVRDSYYQLDDGVLNTQGSIIKHNGSFIQNGGIHNASSSVVLGKETLWDMNVTYELNGGELNTSKIYLQGTFNQHGGSASVSDMIAMQSMGHSTNGLDYVSTYNLENGRLNSNNVYIVSYSGFNQSGGSHENVLLNIVDNGYYNLSDGTLSAKKIVTETVDNFSFTGGTLAVDEFYGNLNMQGGTLAPGHSPGSTHIYGDFTMSSGLLDFEIAGIDDLLFDSLDVSGSASFALGTQLQLSFIDSFLPSLNDEFRFMLADSFSDFDLLNISVIGLDSGYDWQILSGFANNRAYRALLITAVGNNNVDPVPEPAVLVIFVSGLLGFVWLKKYRAG